MVNFAQEYFHILYLYYKKANENMKKKKKKDKQTKATAMTGEWPGLSHLTSIFPAAQKRSRQI